MKLNGIELHPDEEVKTIFRAYAAHPLAAFALAFLLVFFAFYFFVPLWYLHVWRWDLFTAGRIIFSLMLIVAAYLAIRAWVVYRGTMLVVTGERVIDVHRRGLFDRIVSEIPYASISDVSYRSKGMVEMLANIGTITFQTMGGKENIAFKYLYNPGSVHKIVTQLRAAALNRKPNSSDPVENIVRAAEALSPTEKRALYTTVKKMSPQLKRVEKFDAEDERKK